MNGNSTDDTILSINSLEFITLFLSKISFDVINICQHELYDRQIIDYFLDQDMTTPRKVYWDGMEII